MCTLKTESKGKVEVATLGGGCFWCIEAVLSEVKGVAGVVPGYAGGDTAAPTYEEVCTGTTGHAEVVQVTFNPEELSFRELLEIFFVVHDPTTLNQQGADVGTQYRSVIFYHNRKQREEAEKLIKEFNESKIWGRPIVTKVEPLKAFYRAEEYHRKFYARHPEAPYCRAVIAPKLAKLRKQFQKKLKKT